MLEAFTRSGSVALAGWLAAALLAAAAAEAARLVDVRVGRHPEFVRVVFETDAPAAFAVEPGEPGESRVRIDAGVSEALSLPPDADAKVSLEPLPGGATLARIRTTSPVRVESQVLDHPPRIVFDLRPGEVEVRPVAAERTEAPAAPKSESESKSELESKSEPEPEPEPAPRSEPELAPEPEVALVPAPASAAVPDRASAAGLEPPPVSAAPPAALAPRLDDRSLLLGAAAVLALGVGVGLLARGRRAAPSPSMTPMEVAVVEDAPRPPLPMAPWAAGDPLAADLLGMFQRLDDRLAGAEQALAGLTERADRLERRAGVGAEELASQRMALARLAQALGRPLGTRDPNRPAEPQPAATTTPRSA